jgi:hypothetical protein
MLINNNQSFLIMKFLMTPYQNLMTDNFLLLLIENILLTIDNKELELKGHLLELINEKTDYQLQFLKNHLLYHLL